MWFIYSLFALLCWSFSDLFSKIGCADSKQKYNALKMITAVGVIMGIHALYSIIFNNVELSLNTILTYLPVSALYIASMAIGYVGLRYIELSVSSPICNSSGAVVFLICILSGAVINKFQMFSVILVVIGLIGLGFTEATEDEDLRKKRQEKSNFKYAKSPLALLLPIIYCILDASGTYADSIILERIDENEANTAYELTFLLCGIICFIYVRLIKKESYLPKKELPKYVGGIFETIGQFAYIFALSDTDHVALSAPIISAYCAVSVLWGRLFLKEKLSWKHYLSIIITIAGIIIIGIFEE